MTKRERDIRKINLVIGILALLVIFAITYFILYDSGTGVGAPDAVVAGLRDKKEEDSPKQVKEKDKGDKENEKDNTDKEQNDPPPVSGPYAVIRNNFEGKPDEAELKQKMDAVMKKHKAEITDASLLRFANMLVALRKNSRAGIREMDILQHMLDHGNGSNSLQVQAAFSKSALERARS